MKSQIARLIGQSLDQLQKSNLLPAGELPAVQIDRARDPAHGDFASNIAMLLAKAARRKPRELADLIVSSLPDSGLVTRVEIAGPGFINFFIADTAYHRVIEDILQKGSAYGRSQAGGGQSVQVEFVSANPTGPLHVGHGRGAAYGATLANLLAAAGYNVQREYYVNDAGRQMDILALSVWLRYLERFGQEVPFPANGYRGDYIYDIAEQLQQRQQDACVEPAAEVGRDLPPDETAGGDKEHHVDALVERAKTLLGEARYRTLFDLSLNAIQESIRADLAAFGVLYDNWFSERSLTASGAVDSVLRRLEDNGQVYRKDGAQWFKSSAFGDEKDRVVKRENGQTTYFASDIAYLVNKFERGFKRIIYVWGADHHGYVPRLMAACQALGYDPQAVEIPLVQFANLFRHGERVQMSTRSGEFVTLDQLCKEVGADAARFFYVNRKYEQHLDFDLDLAVSQSKDNPVYYIQYAHARICSVFAKLAEQGQSYSHNARRGSDNLSRLSTSHESALMAALSRYPEVLESAAQHRDPHLLAQYLRELANVFHTYYNEHRVLVDDLDLRDARLTLSAAVRQVVANGLELLGVSAPESM